MSYQIIIPLPPPALRGNSRAHRLTKHSISRQYGNHALEMKALLVSNSVALPIDPAKLTFHFANTRDTDLDNLAIGMKPFTDGLVAQGILVDDSPDHVTYGEPTFSKLKHGHNPNVRVVLEAS